MRRGFQDRPCRRFDCHCLLHSAADWNFFEPTCYNRRKDNHHERNYQRLHHWRKNLEEANDALASIGAGVKLDPKRNTIKPGEEADFGLPHSFFQGGIYHESSLETLVKSCRYPGCQNRCPDCRRCRAGRCELARDRLRLCAGRSAVLADLCRGASGGGRWQQLKIS